MASAVHPKSAAEEAAAHALHLAVVHFPEGWRILMRGRRWGRFDHKVDAEEAALRMAADARRRGVEASVAVQSVSGELLLLPPLDGPATLAL